MKRFAGYVSQLRELVEEAILDECARPPDRLFAALDGQPSRELRRRVPLSTRRRHGAFFTGSVLASTIAAQLPSRSPTKRICDPACGVGDLLIAAAERLPVQRDLWSTLCSWSAVLRGYDIHPEFVEAARLRLVLAAIKRGARAQGLRGDVTAFFEGIRVSDGLQGNFSDVDAVLLNPPYSPRLAPKECDWTTGRVSEAAVFTHNLLDQLTSQTQFIAILPDVLRTGSRYRKWRRKVEDRLQISEITPLGVFDQWADVNVFLLSGRAQGHQTTAVTHTHWWSVSPTKDRVRDRFAVHVGAVVPHRDKNRGRWAKYVHVRMLSGLDYFEALLNLVWVRCSRQELVR